MTNVVSRFRVSKDDPNQADPASEEELLRIARPFWNHDGGTICFGPDGYLYVAHWATAAPANDPHDNGQNLKTLLGKMLRIDVDHKSTTARTTPSPRTIRSSARPDARPEIWAYGLRNVWRMAFDRKTGELWAADVGQNLYEEIDLIVKGGNYGWNLREGLHPFGASGVGPQPDLIDPIWEYHHDVGKSITGGRSIAASVCRSCNGSYLYADYVTGQNLGPAVRRRQEARRRQSAHSRSERADHVVRRGREGRGVFPDVHEHRARDLLVREGVRGGGREVNGLEVEESHQPC